MLLLFASLSFSCGLQALALETRSLFSCLPSFLEDAPFADLLRSFLLRESQMSGRNGRLSNGPVLNHVVILFTYRL